MGMKNKKYENYQDFIIAFDSTPEEIIKRETYDLLKLYNQTQQQLQAYKDKEDKIKAKIEHYQNKDTANSAYASYRQYEELLQILNEGDK